VADSDTRRKERPAPERAAAPEGLKGLPGYLEDHGPPDLDRLVHERVRLGMLSALAVNEKLAFPELRSLLKTTDGNLSVHARKLEEAGYVTCRKGFRGRVPRTEFRLTAAGRQALERYLDHMESLIRAMR
jgi:DNA-binding MarR family transcriptional regulator